MADYSIVQSFTFRLRHIGLVADLAHRLHISKSMVVREAVEFANQRFEDFEDVIKNLETVEIEEVQE